MGVMAVRVLPDELDKLMFLDGPWRNDSCLGYMIDAMTRLGYNKPEIHKVVMSMKSCFDDTTVEEAAKHWYDF